MTADGERQPDGDRPARRVCALLAEFDSVDALHPAARAVRDKGFTRWDCHTPFPVHRLDQVMGIRPTILPWLVLGAGMTGVLAGLVLAWWSSSTSMDVPHALRGYRTVISGKPFNSLPAYVPVMFELAILFAALAAGVGMLVLNRLPRLHHPLLTSQRFRRATQDRFFIAIDADDPLFDREGTAELLRSLGAQAVEELEEDAPHA